MGLGWLVLHHWIVLPELLAVSAAFVFFVERSIVAGLSGVLARRPGGIFPADRKFVFGAPDLFRQGLSTSATSHRILREDRCPLEVHRSKNGASSPMRFADTSAFNHPFVCSKHEISSKFTLGPRLAPWFQIPRRRSIRAILRSTPNREHQDGSALALAENRFHL